MKRGAGKAKGGAFERLVCKKLSLWWTRDERDDVFYRTASSGGRATQRSKKHLKTFGQYGDIQAADPIGQQLMDLCVIECKDGYASNSIADLLDQEPKHNPVYRQFLSQARASNDASGSPYWLLIARRRGRKVLLYMPAGLWYEITHAYNRLNIARPMFEEFLHIRASQQIDVVAVQFELFLEDVKPKIIQEVIKEVF